jgi:hypothetical protein
MRGWNFDMSAFERFPEELAAFEELLVQAAEIKRETGPMEEAIRLAESLVARFPNEADAHHMLGLAWYDYPSSFSMRSWRCKMALEVATRLDPDHQYALQYQAYLAFDQERCEDALRLQKQLRHGYFIERDQEWRALKNAETSLVCRLRLDPTAPWGEEMKAFFEWYRDAKRRADADFKSGSYVPPQELREYAEWLYENGTPLSDERIAAIRAFVFEIGYAESYWNPELRRNPAGLSGSA